MTNLLCPSCGGAVLPVQTRYGPRHSCCGLWSWGGAPLVDANTHEARKAAHAAFDVLWKSKLVRRGHAYRLLAEEMGLTSDECHMKSMDADTARRVVVAVASIRSKMERAS